MENELKRPFFEWLKLNNHISDDQYYDDETVNEVISLYLNKDEKYLSEFKSDYHGEFYNERTFTEVHIEEIFNIPSMIYGFVNWDNLSNYLFASDFVFIEGYVFKK